ncbi:ATP-binding protein [Xanthobacter autotrophicus]|uniref:ATP-binding protein n=1 Tax=Xanthobacter autotrophicus TaxID=280 RepID=UPI0024A61A60|nr:ATP-binding protein [Xanthobacter autotrophicus]MDI4655284.1 histidine kinase [Xanthobacter autotrophicus]
MSLPGALPSSLQPGPVPRHGLPVQPRSAVGRRASLRLRVLGVVLAINAAAAVVAGAVVVHNARVAAEREMTASVEMAERMVRETAERMAEAPAAAGAAAGDSAGDLAGWPVHLRHLRHVRIVIEDAQGRPVPLKPPRSTEQKDADGGAPLWFAHLVGVKEVVRDVEVHTNGALFGRVRIAGVPDDEVDEVWEDVSDFAVVAIAVNAAILLALYLALGRVRSDLAGFRRALGELEQSRFSCRVDLPRTRELAEVAERFNELAAALAAARAENNRLSAHLVTLQEDERRQIASELHDELGPLMFGLKAGAESLARAAAEAEGPARARIAERTQGLVGIVERMQATNRRLLRRIRPAALDLLSLGDAISSLLADFRQHDPARTFLLAAGPLAAHYCVARDATLYRCIQEAVTNALKHGDARTIRVEIGEVDTGPAYEGARMLRLGVIDDGRGPPDRIVEGLGLAGMRERVRALGGTCRFERGPEGGGRFVAEIPVPPPILQEGE